ncbi:hypothetical protein B0H19DRAFT_1161251 [Mycena capillaripes]|nr:hypothetical protein B0H19DRAFT_1161251 [Mycena capillaripes]
MTTHGLTPPPPIGDVRTPSLPAHPPLRITNPIPRQGRSADLTAHRNQSCLRLRRSLSKVACHCRAHGASCIIPSSPISAPPFARPCTTFPAARRVPRPTFWRRLGVLRASLVTFLFSEM